MSATLPRIAPDELAALRGGDEDALAHVFASHYHSLATEAEAELGEPTGLSRVVESAFVRAWRERERLETPDAFEQFLHQALHEGAVREKSRRAALHRFDAHAGHRSSASVAHEPPPPAEPAWSGVAGALHAPVPDDEHAARVRADLSKQAVEHHLAVVATKRSLKYPILLAVAFLAIAVPLGWWLSVASKHAVTGTALGSQDARVVTAPAAQRGEVTLLDGGAVTLMNGSSIRIPKGYGDALRAVQVIGAAEVRVPAGLVTPLDTRVGPAAAIGMDARFDVSAEEGRDVVLRVRHGEVLVKTPAVTRAVGRGEAVTIAADGSLRPATDGELREALGWSDGRFVVRERTLRETLGLIRRWYGMDITVADAALFDRLVTMDVPLSSAREAIAALETSARVKFGYDGSRSMILRDAVPVPARAR